MKYSLALGMRYSTWSAMLVFSTWFAEGFANSWYPCKMQSSWGNTTGAVCVTIWRVTDFIYRGVREEWNQGSGWQRESAERDRARFFYLRDMRACTRACPTGFPARISLLNVSYAWNRDFLLEDIALHRSARQLERFTRESWDYTIGISIFIPIARIATE